MNMEPKAKRSNISEPAFILKSLYLIWSFAEEVPTHSMHFFKYKKLPRKNLTFLTINVVTGKILIFQNIDYFKALTQLLPTFSFSLEQMSISMETTARNKDVRTHIDF